MNENRKQQLTSLIGELKIKGNIDISLVNMALTHPSYLYEGGGNSEEHNQRLEFLGDAILGLVIADFLYQKNPGKTEGELTKMRAAVVCEPSLAWAAQHLNLGSYLLLGHGEEQMGGASRSSNLADCFEAFLGALYLSIGLEGVRPFILKVLMSKINTAAKGKFGDYKTQLQEIIQRVPNNKIEYRILEEIGPDHDKTFLAAVCLNDQELARGQGRTKKEAEQHAAKLAMENKGVS